MEASYKCFSSWFPKRQYILLAGGSTGTDTWKRCLRPLKGCRRSRMSPLPSAPFCLSFPFVCHSRRESAFLTTFHESLTTRLPYRLDFSNCRACSKLVSVSFAPLRPHHMKT